MLLYNVATFLFVFIALNINHLSDDFECVMLSGIIILYAIKSISVWANQDIIRNLKSRLRKAHLTSQSSIYLTNDSRIYLISEKISTRLLTIANFGFSLNAIFTNLTSDSPERVLVYKIYIPFNYQTIVPFISTMIWQMVISFYCCLYEICTSGLLHGFVMILASEFQLIGDSLRSFDYTKGIGDLKPIIQKYQNLIEIAKELESSFSFSNFATFIGSMILICFTILEIFTNQHQLIRNLVFLIFLVIMANQMFFLCYYCQKLETASKSVAENLMKSNWNELKNPNIRMAIHFSLMRAQKPIKLTAAKFADINLETFKNIMKELTEFINKSPQLFLNCQ
ncbi:unnamed protein product [Chironomus riparius]|uniref:Odorant receptor n=1 Tax=Chironomus riparius TaxID=315576 RepID=A0A9N9S526_9DIPT|nr:unnamed protein product [Chironomus riparius]